MSSFVIKYARDERVRYISHLDFVRMIHRSIRRSPLKMEFSQGFNPHPIMTVAIPLSVGVTSDCEYLRIGLDFDGSEKELCEILNSALPAGYSVRAAKKVANSKELDFSKLNMADYTVAVETKNNLLPDFGARLEMPEVKVMRETKSGVKESDIRPHIHALSSEMSDGRMLIKMTLSAGNEYNLKPDTVVEALNLYAKAGIEFFVIHRNLVTAGGKEYL